MLPNSAAEFKIPSIQRCYFVPNLRTMPNDLIVCLNVMSIYILLQHQRKHKIVYTIKNIIKCGEQKQYQY